MKKWLVISFLLFACLSIVYSWTDLIVDENLNPSTEGFNITAFKEGTTPRFYIRLYSGISTDGRTLFEKDSSGQDSSLSVYDVSAIIKNTSKIDDALILEIGTNYKRDILISVTFYPFVRVSDPNQSTVDAVYSFNGNNAADKGSLTATYRGEEYTYSSVICKVGGSGSGDVTASSLGGTTLELKNAVSAKLGSKNVTPPTNGESTLLGIGENLLVSRCRFAIKSINMNNYVTNEDYISYVALTVTSI